MYTYKISFIDNRNNVIEDVLVHADNVWKAFDEARKEYTSRKWNFNYWDLAGEIYNG